MADFTVGAKGGERKPAAKILVHCAIGRSNIDLSRTEGEVPRRPALRVAAEGTGVVGMSDKNPDHRKINAQRQRNEVQTRIRAALEQLRSEALVEQSNGGTVASRRLSLASVLRRAGGIDKNTLKQPYHASLRQEVELFLQEPGWNWPAKKKLANRNNRSVDLDHYAQMLVAAHVVRDDALKKLAAAQAEIQQQKADIASLETEVAILRDKVLNVVPISGAGREQAER